MMPTFFFDVAHTFCAPPNAYAYTQASHDHASVFHNTGQRHCAKSPCDPIIRAPG